MQPVYYLRAPRGHPWRGQALGVLQAARAAVVTTLGTFYRGADGVLRHDLHPDVWLEEDAPV